MICPHCDTIITPQTACEKLDVAFYSYKTKYGYYPNLLLCTSNFREELLEDAWGKHGIYSLSVSPSVEKYRTMLIEVSNNVKLFKVGYIE